MGEGGGAANGRAKGGDDIKTWMKQRNDHVRTLRQNSVHPARAAADSTSAAGDRLGPRLAAGSLANDVGLAAGAVRGALHVAEGVGQGAQIAQHVLDPFYTPLHPTSAVAPLYQAAVGALRGGEKMALDPAGTFRQANLALNPAASPIAPTVAGEIQRQFDIGMNQGELGFNVVSGIAAPEAMAARVLPVEEQAARWMAKGLSEPQARYMTEPYVGMGSHFYPRGAKLPERIGTVPLPKFLAGRPMPLPKAISDSRFNVLKPSGISRGDMYEMHFQVDPRFNVARLPPRLGKSWRGKALGIEKHGPIGRIVHGAPTALKQTVGGGAGGAGGVLSAAYREDQQ
jgi:hypothetical protein